MRDVKHVAEQASFQPTQIHNFSRDRTNQCGTRIEICHLPNVCQQVFCLTTPCAKKLAGWSLSLCFAFDIGFATSSTSQAAAGIVPTRTASAFQWRWHPSLDGANIRVRRERTFVFETFGASASLKQLLRKFGFNAENVVAAAK